MSTDEVYGSIEEGSLGRGAAAGAQLAVLRVQGRPATCSPGPTSAPTGSPVCVTRCSNNYGPYQFPEKVIPLFVTNLIDGGTVPLYGEGANVRDWLHVDDHCRGIHLVLEGGPAGRDLQHRRRHRADQQGAHRPAARGLRRRTGSSVVSGRGPQGPRPALLGRHHQDHRRARLRAAGRRSSRAWPTPSQWYRDNRDWWEPLKQRAALSMKST